MTVVNPQFNDNGALTFCEECPWYVDVKYIGHCRKHDCPTEDTYQQAAEAAREGR